MPFQPPPTQLVHVHCNNPFCGATWPAHAAKKTKNGAWECLRCFNTWYETPVPAVAVEELAVHA